VRSFQCQLPSPQRGRGGGGEGETAMRMKQGQLVLLNLSCTELRHLDTLAKRHQQRDRALGARFLNGMVLKVIAPHPQPLSRVGARGAEVLE
jgi:hypothetical protein